MTPTDNPLSEQDFQRLKNGLDAAKRALARADMATRAGFDVSQQIASIQQTKTQIEKTLNTYFPSR